MTAISQVVSHGPQIDAVMVFGFVVGFFTVVTVLYRNHLKSTLPVLGVLLSAMAVYGFMQGCWPLGFVMVALAGSELWRWWQAMAPPKIAPMRVRQQIQHVCESRMSRMFGA